MMWLRPRVAPHNLDLPLKSCSAQIVLWCSESLTLPPLLTPSLRIAASAVMGTWISISDSASWEPDPRQLVSCLQTCNFCAWKTGGRRRVPTTVSPRDPHRMGSCFPSQRCLALQPVLTQHLEVPSPGEVMPPTEPRKGRCHCGHGWGCPLSCSHCGLSRHRKQLPWPPGKPPLTTERSSQHSCT